MRSATTCIGFTPPIRTRGLILAFAAGLPHCLQTAAAKSSCSTRCYSQCPAPPSFITAMRSVWETIFTWAIATVVARPCNGVRTGMPDSRERIRSSFIYRSRSTPNITTKPSTSRTSRKIFPLCCGGRAGSSPCEKTSRRFHAARLNFSTRTMRKCWHSFVAGRTRRLSWWRISRDSRSRWN